MPSQFTAHRVVARRDLHTRVCTSLHAGSSIECGSRVRSVLSLAMDDDALWAAFSSSALPSAEWTHEAHIRTAFLFVQRFDLDEAHLRMRAGIIRLNERHGLVETSARGYFETLTRTWLVLVDDARRRSGAASSLALIDRCPELMDRMLPLRHYSKERLMTTRARSIFVAPDLEPLPE